MIATVYPDPSRCGRWTVAIVEGDFVRHHRVDVDMLAGAEAAWTYLADREKLAGELAPYGSRGLHGVVTHR